MFLFMVLALVVTVAILIAPSTQNAWLKIKTYAKGGVYMVRSNDLPKNCSNSRFIRIRPNAGPTNAAGKRTVRIVFIRHGQSVWNSLFNAFGLGWPLRMVRSVILETMYFFTKPYDSLIIDSPLSAKGKKEAQELSDFLKTAKGKVSMDTSSSVVVASNLRRAMETAVIGLGPRLSVTRERVVVDSSLQEGSRNIDAQSFSTEAGKLAQTRIHTFDTAVLLHAAFDPCLNEGNKKTGVNVYDRMDNFVRHVFDADNLLIPADGLGHNTDIKEIIVVGHSGWFRYFFKRFLPQSSTHISKTKKMKNCAMVSFNLVRDEGTNEVSIDESTLQILYRGF